MRRWVPLLHLPRRQFRELQKAALASPRDPVSQLPQRLEGAEGRPPGSGRKQTALEMAGRAGGDSSSIPPHSFPGQDSFYYFQQRMRQKH